MFNENTVKNVLQTLTQTISQENQSENEESVTKLIKEFKSIDAKNPDIFNTLIMFPLNQALTSAISQIHEPIANDVKDDYKPNWIYLHYQFLESNIEKLIYNKTKNQSGITDKSRHIIKLYLTYSLTDIVPEENFTKEHYWIPKFGTVLDWMELCDGLYQLYHGDSETYLLTSLKLMKSDVRKYKHTRHTLIMHLKEHDFTIDMEFDKKPDLPEIKNDYYLVPRYLIKDNLTEKLRYELTTHPDDKNTTLLYYRIPLQDIIRFSYTSEEIEL